MTPTARPTALPLGFLTVLDEGGCYVGGYLVTNTWGRPLEFRVSSPVQPTRVQAILYAGTLEEALCGELIGRTLVEKAGTAAQLLVTDRPAVLSVRRRVETPTVYIAPPGAEADASLLLMRAADSDRPAVYGSPEFPDDLPAVRELLGQIGPFLDLLEPFARIREAVVEARRAGASRVA